MHIESFAPPKAKTSSVVIIVGLIVLALIVVSGIFLKSTSTPTPTSTPSTAAPSPTTSLPGQPFRTPNDNAGGRWEIVDHRWTSEGLSVRIRIVADDGPVTYSFMAFANAAADVIDPSLGPDAPALDRGTLADRDQVEGWVFFNAPRGDTTIILATAAGRQMSALSIKG